MGSGGTHAGWFDADHIPEAVQAAVALGHQRRGDGFQFSGVYWTLNPVHPDLISRRANRVAFAERGFALTTDRDIVSRRWILVDVDPVRISGVSSTNEEKQAAEAIGKAVLSDMSSRGWPAPIILDSGNGFHLLFRVDLPNDEESARLVKNVLRALAHKFDSDRAKIDTGVFNAARICKFYGTFGRKGDDTPERPHRQAKPLSIPDAVEIVGRELLEDVAKLAPPERKAPLASGGKSTSASVSEQARAYLASIDPAVSGQNGHGKTFWAACQLVQGFGLSVSESLPLLQEYNDRLGEQWGDSELLHKLEDAEKRPGERGYLLSRGGRAVPVRHASEFVEFEDEAESDPLAGLGLTLPTPEGEGAAATSSAGDGEPIRNFQFERGEKGPVAVPLPMAVITRRVLEKTGGWPKRVGECLFVPNTDRPGVQWIQNVDSLFAFLGERTGFPPQFVSSSEDRHVHTKRELFEHLKRTAESFDAVETLPHEPLMKGHYYACDVPASGTGEYLRRLVDMFSPETEIDRDLILSAFVTPFWGGEGGTRPAFCITSDAGRGCGKSTLAACIADLAGGAVEISSNEDIQQIKTRFLSSEGLRRRGVLLDNVKSSRFSSAELEALITSRTISGKRLYEGEAQRPNTLTFLVTLNGVNLSKDLAQRCVIVKLAKPEFSPTWSEDVRRFIDENRGQLVADALEFLRRPAGSLPSVNRWGVWQQAVLSRLPEPAEAIAVIREREAAADCDQEESEIVEEFFRKALEEIGFNPDQEKVFIPSAIAADWYAKAVGERMSVPKASRTIRQRIEEGQFESLLASAAKKEGRGFEWWGANAEPGTVRRNDIEHQIEINRKPPYSSARFE